MLTLEPMGTIAPTQRPTVVLLHSSASSAGQWRALADALQPRFRVHAVEFHGHGTRADWDGVAPLTLADDAALVEPLLRHAGRVHLVGHSYGGAVALKLASLHRTRVRSVTVFEPVLFRLLMEDPASRAPAHDVTAVADWMRARLECEHSESAAQRFVDYWSGAGAWLALPASRRVAVAARMPSVLHHFDALFREPAQHVQLMTLVMPMLVMSGAKTVSATRRVGELLRTLLPHARHDVLPDMGHMGPLTHAAQVNQRIVQFLHGVMSSSGTRANNNAAAAAASLG